MTDQQPSLEDFKSCGKVWIGKSRLDVTTYEEMK